MSPYPAFQSMLKGRKLTFYLEKPYPKNPLFKYFFNSNLALLKKRYATLIQTRKILRVVFIALLSANHSSTRWIYLGKNLSRPYV